MELSIKDILQQAIEAEASDLFLVAGRPASCRVHGRVITLQDTPLKPPMTAQLISEIYQLAGNRSMERFDRTGDDDFAFAIPGLSRFRVSAYKQRGTYSATIRIITFSLPDPEKLGIASSIIRLGEERSGLVLVTGPAGSGKSTTLACIIDQINKSKQEHIITLEDPLEFLHPHNQSIVSQREIHADTKSYVSALRAALRQSPDVILLGEMRDYETIEVAMTAAETGHLILSTLHTRGAASTIDRIIDVFPANQQQQICVQLSLTLKAVVSQQLLPTTDGRVVPAFEILTMTPAIQSMIREKKIHQIEGMLYNSAKDTMLSMDSSLLRLYQQKIITRETALTFASNPEMLGKRLL
ncbi:MAG: PilT/PilU family type 4a pilus ATPase [Lachnospiraceae bacterium]|nr:PilT/PilU family type 4a pilus ATPase [Lachnospiraceae bacterium]